MSITKMRHKVSECWKKWHPTDLLNTELLQPSKLVRNAVNTMKHSKMSSQFQKIKKGDIYVTKILERKMLNVAMSKHFEDMP